MRAAVAAGFPSGNDVHVLKEIKASIKKFDSGAPLRVVEYPARPADLPFFEDAYAASDPPTLLDERKVLDSVVALRKTNKSSVQAHKSSVQAQSFSTQAEETPSDQQLLHAMRFMGRMFMQGRAADLDVDMLRPTKRRKALEDETAMADAQQPNPPAASAAVGGTTKPGVLALKDKAEPDQKTGPPTQPPASILTKPEVSAAVAKVPKTEAPEDEEDGDVGPEELANMTMKKPAAAKSNAKGQAQTQKKPATMKPGPASKTKESVSEKMRGGWKRERRYRQTGQVDVHYISPSGKSFRTLQEARQNGYRD